MSPPMLEKLGKYRIDSVLGKGAMGTVYKAFDPNIARTLALKTIRKELLGEHQQIELISRFKNEAQAAGRLMHPNIVAVYDYGEDAGTAYIAMEFVEGTPLNSLLIAHGQRELKQSMGWMRQLLGALDYAHSRGVVHRDIKPANLLITDEGQVKITDFGIARIDSSTLTQTGSMIGTPSYMSPEQFCGELVDGRSDVFSAGIVLYQLLTGERPFSGSATMVMQQILNQTPVHPSSLNPSLDPALDAIVARALAKRPDDRYASAQAFLDALESLPVTPRRADPPPQVLDIDEDRTLLITPQQAMVDTQEANVVVPQTVETSATGTQDTQTPWKLEAAPELESLLSHQIGPMARFLVRKALAPAPDFDAVCASLLPHIPSERGREQFVEATRRLHQRLSVQSTTTDASSTGSAISSGVVNATLTPELSIAGSSLGSTGLAAAPTTFDQAFAELAERRLTVLIGPIARIVVTRASRKTQVKQDFLQLLSEHITNESERNEFLRTLGNAGSPT